MISEVYVDRTEFKAPPHKFEAGTPAIAEVIALKSAVSYLESMGMKNVREHEKQLTAYALSKLKENFGDRIKILGPQDPGKRGGVIAFTFRKYHPHDIASILDEEGIAVRAGHHCAMPLHGRLKVDASLRASFYMYNDQTDVDKLIVGLKKVEKIL